MKNIIKTSLFIAIIVLFQKGYCQNTPLKIGEQVPEIIVPNTINFNSTSVKLSDLKGKLLILDFWATWCSPCVAMLPKTDSLQKAFNGQVQFLPVTTQANEVAAPFLKKLGHNKNMVIPSVVNDKILSSYFPHMTVPYYVWIDQAGKVIATTEQDQINPENIKQALKGELKLRNSMGGIERIVNRAKRIFIPGIPFIENDSSNIKIELLDTNNILLQSIATKYIPNVSGAAHNNSTHFVITNCSLLYMYQFFYGINSKPNTLDYWNKNRFKIEIADSIKNKITSNDEFDTNWIKENGYCYEIVWKSVKSWDEKVSLLKDDLDRYFAKPLGIRVELEKRLIPCYVMIVIDSTKLKTTGGKATEKHDAYTYSQHNMSISRLKNQLDYFWQGSERTLVNETQFKGKVDIELNCKMADKIAVNNELKKVGLQFIEADRLLEVLVVKKRN